MGQLVDILNDAIDTMGSQGAVADAIGVSTSFLGRVIKKKEEHSLGVANCLRLAKATRRSADEVLRAAGKQDVADLLDLLYGRSANGIEATERQLLDEWARLTPADQAAMRTILRKILTVPVRRRSAKAPFSQKRRLG